MVDKPIDTQIVMRVTDELDRKIYQAAKKMGLTKASWLRQTAIKALEVTKNV